MGVRRGSTATPNASAAKSHKSSSNNSSLQASDALPLPLYLTNGIFFTLFFAAAYFLLHLWRDKIRTSTPLHVVNLSEIAATVSLIASIIYLLGFFGIGIVQSFISTRSSPDAWDVDDETTATAAISAQKFDPCGNSAVGRSVSRKFVEPDEDDEKIIESVISGSVPSYSLKAKLGDCKRAAMIRRNVLQRITGRSLKGLPLDGFDYESILEQCCEMPIGYVQMPVGIAGPLLLDGKEYTIPMATTEGCLVASTNRGCKAIYASGGASTVVYKDGMTRAPVVQFDSIRRAAELNFYLEDPASFGTISVVFNRSSRFARLQQVERDFAGRNLHLRFTASTGDAMGMNMVSKGVQNVLDFLQETDFPI